MYNLLNEAWIPVRWAPGSHGDKLPDRVGLREALLRSQDIAGLAVPEPPAHAALLRILYALTARGTGLDEAGPGNWYRRREAIAEAGRLPESGVEAYFARYADRFFLYDPDGGRPWMQDIRLAEQCDPDNTAGVNKLIVTRPSGNNHAWFRHGSDARPDLPEAPEAVLNLLVWHYYGPSGRCSAREVNGVKSASTTAGPLRTALSYHPEGASLFETLLAGLVPPKVAVRRTEDLCPWEWNELPDPEKLPAPPVGPCARLTACSQHALLLKPGGEHGELVEDAFITWAYRSGRVARDDDYLIWQISKQGNRYPRPADSQRALWRDLDALLLHRVNEGDGPQRPLVFESAEDLGKLPLRVRALGFEQEGQAKDTQFMEGSTPPVLGLAEELAASSRPAVARLRQYGEVYGRRLDRAVKRAWAAYVDDAKADTGTWSAEAAARYWPGAETEFWARFRRLDRTGRALGGGLNLDATRSAFLRLAEASYDTVTTSVTRTLRGAKAVSEARIELYGGRHRTR
ncbi:type I-E CRISPR-associated protein Cse1/CasA [Actinacidiphila sp. ITFR-21]|uniref:type I-E CRISPR-associated protein Cse1/CasA n=1 Tax=Actinacidiphila sp. ITFR-21 TaxID=3075199 RepID=UPI00288C2B60|nr:type I-E CRISPR-associated protein Cse1/CasA [Streptomyces sp. ITFR-21]WNI19862.1 type I-E CRISPR-associated protein Cse1/CasA [Streptomyces sp. ITFR-21]